MNLLLIFFFMFGQLCLASEDPRNFKFSALSDCSKKNIRKEIDTYEKRFRPKHSFHLIKIFNKGWNCEEEIICSVYMDKNLKTIDPIWRYCSKSLRKKKIVAKKESKLDKCEPQMIGQYVIENGYRKHSIPKMAKDLGCQPRDICNAFIFMYPDKKEVWQRGCEDKGFW